MKIRKSWQNRLKAVIHRTSRVPFYVVTCLAAAIVFLMPPLACTSTIIPPTEVDDPVRVVLLDHGRHASLVLPRADRGMVRYTYGDWHCKIRLTRPEAGEAGDMAMYETAGELMVLQDGAVRTGANTATSEQAS